jgi:NADPH-dependent ferric siderophore reductase
VRVVPPGTPIDVIASVPGAGDWVAEYLGPVPGTRVQVVAPDVSGGTVLGALERLGPVGDGVFVWAAGEAAGLVPVRRHLRRTLGLPPAQAQVSGYWRRGVEAFDHHAPIDPFDPDE